MKELAKLGMCLLDTKVHRIFQIFDDFSFFSLNFFSKLAAIEVQKYYPSNSVHFAKCKILAFPSTKHPLLCLNCYNVQCSNRTSLKLLVCSSLHVCTSTPHRLYMYIVRASLFMFREFIFLFKWKQRVYICRLYIMKIKM